MNRSERSAPIGAAYIEGVYRYTLLRRWNESEPNVLIIGLNPSTATAINDDPTVRRCIAYARSWGFGSVAIGNLFAYRATDPQRLFRARDPVGPKNDEFLRAMAAEASMVVAAWGNRGVYLNRSEVVQAMFPRLHCLGLTKEKQPRHPLFLPKSLQLQEWR